MARLFRQLSGLCALLLAVACNGTAPAPKPANAGPARGGSLTATVRTEPETFNRFVSNQAAVDAVTRLTHASLTRLKGLDARWILPGHGAPYSGGVAQLLRDLQAV